MRYILLLCGLMGLISCRSYREKTRQENSRVSLSETSKGMRYGFEMIEKDSQNRIWYFSTDSVISFHPDGGLFSNGGRLQITESRIGLQHVQVEIDSLDTKRDVHGMTETQTQIRRWFDYSWGIWGIVVVCALVFLWVYTHKDDFNW